MVLISVYIKQICSVYWICREETDLGGGNVPGGEACSRGGFGVFKVVGEGTTPILSDQVCTFRLKKKKYLSFHCQFFLFIKCVTKDNNKILHHPDPCTHYYLKRPVFLLVLHD